MESQYIFSFPKEIKRWDEALPLGNGFMGALIWGSSQALRFSIDRTDIWDTTPCEETLSPEFSFENMKRIAREGDEESIRRVFTEPYFKPLPSKLPAGKIILDLGESEKLVSRLDITRAQAEVEGDAFRVTSFLSADKKAGLIRVETKKDCRVTLENPDYRKPGEKLEENTAPNSLKQLVYPEAVRVEEETEKYFIQEIDSEFQYGIFLKIKPTGTGCEIAYMAATSSDGENWVENTRRQLSEALEQGYNALFASHCLWWKEYWGKSGISLPDKEVERNWYLTNYLFASCSRKGCFPMPLQGVWTADDGFLPPWKGDYHMDLNLQMSYYHYLKANHMPEGESYLDYLWDMAECGRKFAKEFFGAKKGICMPPVMTIDGKALGGWPMYSLSPTNQMWLCQAFERHWRFTGDREFLKERAYPYCKESAEFILEILEEKDGFYYLPISSSPEIHDDRKEAFLTPNSNYDLALLQYLFEALAAMAEELELEEAEEWKKIRKKLPELAANERKVLMLSPDESLEESHRHMSHLMAVHPLRLMDAHTPENKEIIDASILDLERLGTGNWVGFSFTWMAELYAIQGNGNAAAYYLKTFWRHLCSPNGFHLNGDYKTLGITCMHYRPFTLEANMCAADAVQEMLLQTENGILDFFPAIPEEWEEEASFSTLRGEKGILVSARLTDGKVKEIVLENGKAGGIFIRKSERLTEIARANGWQQEGDFYRVEYDGKRSVFH